MFPARSQETSEDIEDDKRLCPEHRLRGLVTYVDGVRALASGQSARTCVVDLNDALRQFDVVETNLGRLERVIADYEALIPEGIVFTAGSPEGLKADELASAFKALVATLPSIAGWRFDADLVPLDDIAQTRMDGHDIGELSVLIALDREAAEPSRQLAEYRRHLARERRVLVRARAEALLNEIDDLLSHIGVNVERNGDPVMLESWSTLVDTFAELERLLGASVLHRGRWSDLKRHLSFGLGVDARDIVEHDWPDVRPRIVNGLFSDLEPLPVQISDLAELAASKPVGTVSVALTWNNLSAEQFERLIFNLLFCRALGQPTHRCPHHRNERSFHL